MTSVYSSTGYFATYGNDLMADPVVAGAQSLFVNSGSPNSYTGQNWTVTFAPQPGYPGGFPVPISTVVFVNRIDCCNTRITAGFGWIALQSPNGTNYARQTFTSPQANWGAVTSGSVATFRFNDFQTAPVFPVATSPFQLSAANQNNLVRYVKIASAPETCLYFRE